MKNQEQKKIPQIEDLRQAAIIVSEVLLQLRDLSKPGVSLEMLDEVAERVIREMGAEPYNKGYHPAWAPTPYPSTICCSVDFEICHAPPRGRTLQDGSIVNYDVGIRYKTACGDAALTVPVGNITPRQERLLRYAKQALYEGISVVKAGVPISAIGRAVESYASRNGYKIIREFGGHHIGTEMHEKPDIPNVYYPEDDAVLLQEGAVICIEPMLTPGNGRMAMAKEDGWTAFCPDGQPVAMFEAMMIVGKDGPEILTKHL